MSSTTETIESFSTVISWTDFHRELENETGATFADIGASSSLHLKRLISTAVFVGLIVLANLISLIAFLIEKRLRTYNNYFIINLTILDLLTGLGLSTSALHQYLGRYPYSQNACKVLSGIFYGIVNASNINVVVICADRHQAVYDPINHFISRSKRKALILNCLSWVIGLSFWLGFGTAWEFAIGFDNGIHCIHIYTMNPLASIIHRVVVFFLPLAIIAVLYFRIFLKIRKSLGGKDVGRKFDLTDVDLSSTLKTATTPEKASWTSTSTSGAIMEKVEDGNADDSAVTSLPNETNVKTSETQLPIRQRVESRADMKKATRTLLLIVIAFVVAWTADCIISLIYSFAPRLIVQGFSIEAYIFFNLMAYGNSLLNPISYAMSQPLFRATVIRMFSCRRA